MNWFNNLLYLVLMYHKISNNCIIYFLTRKPDHESLIWSDQSCQPQMLQLSETFDLWALLKTNRNQTSALISLSSSLQPITSSFSISDELLFIVTGFVDYDTNFVCFIFIRNDNLLIPACVLFVRVYL